MGQNVIGARTTDGECAYCRDGQHVTLYEYTTTFRSGGDCIPDTEWVCATCVVWLSHNPK